VPDCWQRPMPCCCPAVAPLPQACTCCRCCARRGEPLIFRVALISPSILSSKSDGSSYCVVKWSQDFSKVGSDKSARSIFSNVLTSTDKSSVRLAYQPPDSSTFLSEQIGTSQPPAKRTGWWNNHTFTNESLCRPPTQYGVCWVRERRSPMW
jgi:hypothetical protein